MLYDRRDFGLLRLAGTYQWLPAAPLKKLSALKTLRREAELLSTLGLVSYARSGEYLMPSPQGYEFLSGIDQTCQPPTKRPYAQSPALRRRLEVGTILLTCIGAGIEPAFGKVEHLKRQPVFFPAFALRNAGGNLMNAAGCAGFGHWGSTAYMTLYVSAQNTGFVMTNELGHLHNLASVFSETLDTPQALILAGESYQSVYEVLTKKTLSKRHGKKGFVDYSEAYQKLSIPACIVSCDNTGVMQLAVMRQTDYRARIAQAAFGARWDSGGRRPCGRKSAGHCGGHGSAPLGSGVYRRRPPGPERDHGGRPGGADVRPAALHPAQKRAGQTPTHQRPGPLRGLWRGL